MTRTTTMFFLTLALVVTLGCCSGHSSVTDSAPAQDSAR
jgi:hypothetical protein